MSRRRRVALLVLAGAMVLSTTGVGGFSSAAADRSVSVAVVDDEAAYLGVERSVDGGTLHVNVTNRFPAVEELTVTVDVGDESKTRTVSGSHSFEFAADCDASVHVTADGPGTYVELTRPVPCVADGDDAGDDGDDTDDETDKGDDAGDDVDDGDDVDVDDAAGEDASDDTDDRDGDADGDSDGDADGTDDEDDDTEGEEDDTDSEDDDTDDEETDTEADDGDVDG